MRPSKLSIGENVVKGKVLGGIALIGIVAVAGYLLWRDEGAVEPSLPGPGERQSEPLDGPASRSPRTESPVSRHGQRHLVESADGATIFEFVRNNVLRVHHMPARRTSDRTEVLGREDHEPVGEALGTGNGEVVLETDSARACLQVETGRLVLRTLDGREILSQEPVDRLSSQVRFHYPGPLPFYGLHGYDAWEASAGLLRTGGSIEAGSQGDSGAPLLWSSGGFGLLFDTIGGQIRVEDKTIVFDGSSRPDLEYFVLLGEPRDIMESVFYLSGTSPLFPKWALGFINSEWGMDETELREIVATYRERGIPLDTFTLDVDWLDWGKGDYGNFRWNDGQFPNGASGVLARDMRALGVHLTAILKPRLHTETAEGKHAADRGFLIPGRDPYVDHLTERMSNDVDFTNPEAASWYFEQIEPTIASGIAGFWNDEADTTEDPLQHLFMQKTLYTGQRDRHSRRVWSINRNFYLGAQRYAYGLWSGDIHSGFDSMAQQRARMLSAVNNGAVKWGMDTGGFDGSNPSPENYARWIQFSAFTPIFRVHATQNMQRQPWVFGPVAEAAAKKAIRLRYQLLPYIYRYEYEAYRTGLGIVRPLFYDEPDDDALVDYVDAWMFGDYLLVAPIVEEGQSRKEIYLPSGVWYDFWTGKRHVGPRTLLHPCDVVSWDDIPLFVRSGAILPMQEPMNYVGEKPVEALILHLYPAEEESSFDLYEDDGETYGYETGDYFIQQIRLTDSCVRFMPPQGSFQPEWARVDVIVHGRFDRVRVDGRAADSVVSEEAGQVLTKFSVPAGKKLDVELAPRPGCP